jgi:hypothetical protein
MVDDDLPVIEEMFPNATAADGDVHTTGLRVVVPDRSSPVKADLFDPKVVEFMPLQDFKAWLAKYRLTSS